jgi:hypothetical protein
MARNKRLSLENLEARDVPATAFALGAFTGANADTLFRFDTDTPDTIQATIPITGLVTGDTIVGIDFRPADGQLYGVGANLAADTVQVYRIEASTGQVTAIGGPANVANITGATAFGVDFNPLADRIRVITDLASDGAGGNTNNFRLHPGTGALVAIDTDLDFAFDPTEAPEVAVAYTNSSFTPIVPADTTLFGITQGQSSFVTHSNGPSFATLAGVGPLGVTLVSRNAGLDIFGVENSAIAILETAGGTQLFTIDIATGDATLVDTFPVGLDLSDVTVAPELKPVTITGGNSTTVTLATASNGTLAIGTVVPSQIGGPNTTRSTSADVNGDGVFDTIAVAGPGTPFRVSVISGVDNTTVLVAPFDPFGDPRFTGGGFVAAADLDNDGRAEFIVTPDQGGGPRVTIFSRAADGTLTTRANFFSFVDPNFFGGARAAIGDVNGDNQPDLLVSAGFTGGPRASLFDGATLFAATPTKLVGDFFAFPGTDATNLRNGTFPAIGDINGDDFGDLIFGGGPGGGPRVFILSGQLVSAGNVDGAQANPIANFFVAGNQNDRGGIRVSAQDIDGDNRDDLVVGSGEGSPAKIRAYLGVNFTTVNEPTIFQDLNVFGGGALASGVYVG